jgi:nuclear cap-binding protein subunit 1
VNKDLVSTIVKNVKRESRANPLGVRSMLINCAVQLPAKVPIYSLIIGLINVDEPALVAEILAQAGSELNEALQDPKLFRKARLLLRFMASLVVPGVVQPSSIVSALKTLVDVAVTTAETSPKTGNDTDGRTWQPYTDQLVYMALMAIPFGGSELSAASGTALNELVSAAESYLEKRPRSSQPGLRPFAASVTENDAVAESDNGGASFITEVVTAVKTMIEGESWHLEGIPRVHTDLEATLATAPQTHVIANPTVAATPPVGIPQGASDTLTGALVLQAFPPRGILRLLEDKHTLADRLVVERIVAEDYMIDTVAWFEGDRVECAKHLANLLPIPYSFEPLLCEVMFSQMLRLPNPEFKPIMYSTLMVELCKLLRTFPRAMSACIRECFARMNVMDPSLRERLAEWLAYHLSNFEYLWPWAKWAHVLEAPAYDGQRRFCVAVMNRMVRLSYWDRIQAVVPEEFRVLLPPKPEVTALPPDEETGPEAADAEGAWAAAALKLVRSKASAEEIDAWIAENKLEEVLAGGKIGVLRMWLRCLLVAGGKSYTHMIIALERYYGPLAVLSKDTGLEGQIAIVSATTQTWMLNPQRAVMAVDRLMTLRLISAEAIISWVFGNDGVRNIQDQSRSGMAWEMLRKAVHKTIARVEDATEDLAAGKAAIEAAKAGNGGDLAEAEAALPEKEAYLEETTSQEKGAVMQVLKCFAEALAEGGFAGPDADAADANDGEGMALDADSSEKSILRDYIVASLRSFLREYHVQAAELEDKIQGDILAMGDEEVREVVEVQLQM